MNAAETPVVRYKNGKKVRHDYIVTIRRDHFISVEATSPEDAERRATIEINKRWGPGAGSEIMSVERV